MRNNDRLINTILGPDSAVGLPPTDVIPQFKVAGSLHISGDVRANVTAEGNVVISADSRVQGSVTASSVLAGGIVDGDIVAPEGVTLLSTAVVLGNITTSALRIDEGAVLCGGVSRAAGGKS